MNGIASAVAPETLRGVEELLKALANPIRLSIVLELGRQPRCVHELVEALAAPQPLVSQHLRVLRGARLVAAHRRGKEIEYSLQDAHVSAIVEDAIRHTFERSHA